MYRVAGTWVGPVGLPDRLRPTENKSEIEFKKAERKANFEAWMAAEYVDDEYDMDCYDIDTDGRFFGDA